MTYRVVNNGLPSCVDVAMNPAIVVVDFYTRLHNDVNMHNVMNMHRRLSLRLTRRGYS